MSDVVIPDGEILYRRLPSGRYQSAAYQVDALYRFPEGRWVLVVDGSRSCCLQPPPNLVMLDPELEGRATPESEWAVRVALAWHGVI